MTRLPALRVKRLSELADRADEIAVTGETVRTGSCAVVMHAMRDVIRQLEEDLEREEDGS
jgi:hypothetical protein